MNVFTYTLDDSELELEGVDLSVSDDTSECNCDVSGICQADFGYIV